MNGERELDTLVREYKLDKLPDCFSFRSDLLFSFFSPTVPDWPPTNQPSGPDSWYVSLKPLSYFWVWVEWGLVLRWQWRKFRVGVWGDEKWRSK